MIDPVEEVSFLDALLSGSGGDIYDGGDEDYDSDGDDDDEDGEPECVELTMEEEWDVRQVEMDLERAEAAAELERIRQAHEEIDKRKLAKPQRPQRKP